MELIYKSKLATIYCGDAREVPATVGAKTIDLLTTDPPYAIEYQSNWGDASPMQGDDDKDRLIGALQDAMPCLRDKRHVYVFGYSPSELQEPLMLSSPIEIIWHKQDYPGMGDLSSPWGPAHERITFGPHYKTKNNRLDGRGSLAARLRRGTVLRVTNPISKAARRHPTEKPIELMRQLIESSSCIGETVLDPFAGSGSTLVAAIISGRRCVGVEIDEKYARIAVQRVKAAERVYGQIAGL